MAGMATHDVRYVLFRECGTTEEAMQLHDVLAEFGVDVELRNDPIIRRVPKMWTQVWVANDQIEKAQAACN